ncbi:ribosome assembly factor SBDS [Candidatus Micrarchaeota archaeon CG_4_10_14_0_2_um_filter_60_11]|nr:MAG: rRNA metabolism protein [Candidatus Micrarchaeota archaeon CG1_02_60_51]PIN96663.1 MAG: ribosome assembly factor SBDS [Candidatus Micrarchaeota archaeon CG10_big_fil_rev_8_21_14_0_10_60_32]PIO02408.1 MAG: ribosome assembly factor SBDS [Candidatus Micrarchaeota archaeon CG09_land_8_20_14_0_10_60_16]PIY91465.1 MAG: ribosome assembly factor SBDS [Candidatus Micrarchaeota archaeon CG_4_10_14_0_8_um_filter_60_7]PIZ91272.1 MAG: ribosome assembly factor SBDS [Candidatus Micrarchaeota archaeon 
MSGIENTIIARLERNGEHFEVLVDPQKGFDYKTGARRDFSNVLAFEEVFKDAKKGERATAKALEKAFGTGDPVAAGKIILEKGELQLTTEQKRKAIVDKRARVIALVARVAVDPRTKAPHPAQRIENAMEQAKVHIDAMKTAEEQVEGVIEQLREILPISTENLKMEIIIPAQYAGRAYGALKEYGMSGEEWRGDGSFRCVCSFPAGMQGEFYDKLNKMTAGSVQTKTL